MLTKEDFDKMYENERKPQLLQVLLCTLWTLSYSNIHPLWKIAVFKLNFAAW